MTRTVRRPGARSPEIDDVTRREFLIGAAGLLLLPAGCGGGTEGNSGGGEEDTLLVGHELGESRIPRNPRRPVFSDSTVIDAGLAMGYEPVGAVRGATKGGLPPYLEEEVGELPELGTDVEPNLERIATLEPDLLIGDLYYVEQTYAQLSEIAPTVPLTVPPDSEGPVPFTDLLRYWAGLLGREREAGEVLDRYKRRIEEVREAFGRPLEVAILRASAEGYTAPTFDFAAAGQVFGNLGWTLPAALDEQEVEEGSSVTISRERFDLLDARDAIFVLTADNDEALFEDLRQDPLFGRLRAVRDGHLYKGASRYWYVGMALAGLQVLEDLERDVLPDFGGQS